MAGLVITKVLREVLTLDIRKNNNRGMSIGQVIDANIDRALHDGAEVGKIILEFTEDDWATMIEDTGIVPRNPSRSAD